MDCRVKPGNDGVRERSRDAFRIRVVVQEPISSLSAPIFVREHQRWMPVSSRSVLQAVPRTNGRKQGSGTPRDAYPTDRTLAGYGARRSLRARLSASHHGSCQRDVGPQGSASGQASWDAIGAGVTRLPLSQSSGSTPRTGHDAGEHDAQSRPGAAVTNRHARAPHPAPPCGVTA
jgi:hypothetical protein